MEQNEAQSLETAKTGSGSKKIFVGIAILVLALVAAGVSAFYIRQTKKTSGMLYTEAKFTITIPEGWVKTEPSIPVASLRALFVRASSTDPFKPRIFVASETAGTSTDFDAYTRVKERDIRFRFNLISTTTKAIYTTKAFIARFSFDAQGMKIVDTDQVVIKDDVIYTVSALAEENTYRAIEPKLNAMFESFRVK